METLITNLPQNKDLINRLYNSVTNTLSELEMQSQKASFVFGAISSDNDATRERVENILAKNDGK